MTATLIRTRRPLLGRIAARARCTYLRWLIRHAETDLKRQQAELQYALDRLPAQVDHTKAYVAALAKKLTRATHEL